MFHCESFPLWATVPVIVIMAGSKGTHIHPIVIGCTSYSIVPDGTLHQTGFVFGLFEKDQTTGRFKFPLQVDVPRIPKETIGWDAATGGFAD
jgi:hypothetical protein